MAIRFERIGDLCNDPRTGQKGRLAASRTKILRDFIFRNRPGENELVPGTTGVKKLKPVALGSGDKAIAFISDEVDELIESVRRERDAKLRDGRTRAPTQVMTAD
jgi:hypothetical protein